MNWKHWCLVLCCAGFLAVGCGDDDNPADPGNGNGNGGDTPTTTPPREWQGTWVGTVTTTDNAGSKWLTTADTTESDTIAICDQGFADLEAPFGCITFIGDDSLYINCDTTVTEGSCTASFTIHGYGKRTGTSFTLMGTETGSYVGSGCGEDANYDRTVMATYTRMSDVVPECGEGFPEDTTDVDTTDNGGGTLGGPGLGDYDVREREWDCGNSTPTKDSSYVESFCPSDSIANSTGDQIPDDVAGFECEEEYGNNTIVIECNGEIEIPDINCTVEFAASVNIEFDDDSYDMMGGVTVESVGSGCGDIPQTIDECTTFEINADRTSTTPSDCPDGKADFVATGLNAEVVSQLANEKIQSVIGRMLAQSR